MLNPNVERGASANRNDDIYASPDLMLALPTAGFPDAQRNPEAVFNAVKDELLLDGNSRQNLATFCQTRVNDNVRALMDLSIDKNMIDKDEYPQTAEIEARCVRMLADLWHSPEPEKTLGCSTVGSSEAAMLGGLALKWRWRELRKAAGKSTERPNLVTGPVQICWHKFARYFDVEIREVPLVGDQMILTPEEVIKRIDENTIGVVPTLGVTFTCQYEPVKAIADALDKLQAETGLDVPIHVDGASGAFLAPFCAPELEWDFSIPRVKSINASGHKFGLAPLGVGWVIWREVKDLHPELIFNVNYLGGDMPTFALNFSRPGGQVIAQYYNFIRLGRDGYGKIHNACYATAMHLSNEIAKMGPFKIIFDGNPKTGIPAVSWALKEGHFSPDSANAYSLYDVADRLRTRGWQVPAYSMPANREDLVVQRILVRHGMSMDLCTLLIDDLRRSVEYLQNHPVRVPATEAESGGFTH